MDINAFIKNTITLVFLSWFTISFSQKTAMHTVFEAEYHRAKELYNNQAYAGAQKMFINVSQQADPQSNLKTDADYYDAMISIKRNQVDADKKVIAFVKNHPYSSKKQKAFLNVGNYYFDNRKAALALKWYTKIDTDLLKMEDINGLNYKMGYALLVSGYLKESKDKFATLLGNPVYGNDARYYYGYISYKQNNYGEAENNLSQLSDNETYKTKANYYLLDIAFKSEKYEKAASIGEQIFPTAEKKQKSDIAKVIGESYFNIEKYNKAIPFLLKYEGKNGRWNNTDYYYLGYAYYKQNDYENAIKHFTKIIDGNMPIAQNAYYHLAECYLRSNKKNEALNAFKNAGEMNFNPEITADANYNYAKLSYEEGNPYKSVPEVLKEYLKKYSSSQNHDEISGLLVTSFLYQKDYEGAINHLNTNKSIENNILSKEVSLYRGLQLFNEQKINKAIPYFLIATKSENEIVSNKAKYWMAEANYLSGKYAVSLNEFLAVNQEVAIKEMADINYNIAYAYFKLKDYGNATTYYKKYIENASEANAVKDDAVNRLGDSYYATKNYKNAIISYDKVINEGGSGSDYAQYQKAMSCGFLGQNKKKISNLQEFTNNFQDSKLQDDALFQLAATYTTIGNTEKSLTTYDDLIQQHPKSSYVPSVLLRQGLLSYNAKKNQKALAKFKEVTTKFPNTSAAKEAVKNARNVYVDIGKVEEYGAWVKTLPFINISNSEIDNASYEAAENKLLENKTNLAITGFEKYLATYPNGLNALKAHFYLAESYLKNNYKKKSVPHYNFVIKKEPTEYSEESLVKLSQILLEVEDWKNAIPLLQRLEKEANYPKNIIFAQSNLMKGYYKEKKYEQAKSYAEKVLINDKITQLVEEESKIIIARSAIKTGDFITAQEYYITVGNTATGEMKAESLYYKAFFLNEEKIYEDSNKEIQSLIANYSNYKYWGVKSYIIMAKNYYALNDAYQATYILENVIKNFTQFKDLVEEAKNELSTIKNKEAKTNESVNTQSKI